MNQINEFKHIGEIGDAIENSTYGWNSPCGWRWDIYIQNSSIGRKIKNTNETHQLNVNITNWVELMTYKFEIFLWTKLRTLTSFDYMDDVGTI